MLVVCAAVIHRGDKILLAQRPEGGELGLRWEFPGGKIEEGESPEECIVREIREELDMEVEVESVFDVVYHSYPDKNVLLLVYNCIHRSGEGRPLACRDFKWVGVDMINEFNLAGADIKIAEKLQYTLKNGDYGLQP